MGNILNYLDRVALSVAAPLIAVQMRLSPVQLGFLLGAYIVGYLPACLLGGYAADRLGPTRVIVASAISWSALCALTAAPVGFAVLLGLRVAFGIAEGPFIPSYNKVIGRIFPPNKYPGALALSSAGQPVGGLVAAPIVGTLMVLLGWQPAFVIIGAMGFVWAVAWVAWTRKGQNVEATMTVHGADKSRLSAVPPFGGVLLQLIRNPGVWGVALGEFGFGYILYFFLTWFPSYLVMARHLTLAEMSFASSIPWLFSLIGLIAGGFLSNFLFRWSWGALLGRKIILVGGLLAAGGGGSVSRYCIICVGCSCSDGRRHVLHLPDRGLLLWNLAGGGGG